MTKILKIINPFNHEIIGQLPFETDTTIHQKLKQTRLSFKDWSNIGLKERIVYLEKGLEYFELNKDQIAKEISEQMGKPLSESYNEIKAFFSRVRELLLMAPDALKPDLIDDKKGFVRRIEHQPLGVVLDIAAWNYPLLTAVNVVVPALLAGNAVVIKHSGKTPLCGVHFEKAFSHGFDNLVCNLVLTHDQTTNLINNPLIDHVVFTGSVKGGLKINQATSKRLIDVGLELGGKDPAYIMADADLDFTVPNIIEGACYNAGQSCCAIERVYVHHSIYDAFLSRALEIVKDFKLGNPFDQSTTIGPLASHSAPDFLASQVADAVEKGAEIIFGNNKKSGNFFEPTLLKDVPNHSEIMQEESFGPVIPSLSVKNDLEALEKMNDSKYGLTASIWTNDQQKAEWMAQRLEAGTIFQNRCDYLDPYLPWTGYKNSGKGSSLSRYGFWHLTKRKSIHFRTDIK